LEFIFFFVYFYNSELGTTKLLSSIAPKFSPFYTQPSMIQPEVTFTRQHFRPFLQVFVFSSNVYYESQRGTSVFLFKETSLFVQSHGTDIQLRTFCFKFN
jgi:hypothetical protein